MTTKKERKLESIIRVLYVGMKYDYGDPKRGLCHEYLNFFNSLEKMENIHVDAFFYDEELLNLGISAMNARLIDVLKEKAPQICFFVLFTDEIHLKTIRWISEKSGAKTFNWFADDHWRFDLYSKQVAPELNWIVTTDHDSVEKYHSIGCPNVILSQWGFNHFSPFSVSTGYSYDVSFVGQVHSTRKELVERLMRRNIPIECRGRGWEMGRISTDEMKKMFVQSKINLNFTASTNMLSVKRLGKVLLHRRGDNSFHLNTPTMMVRELQTLIRHQRPQIKGRTFEIPGYGGFLLMEYVESIEHYYIPDKEIVLFRNFDELVEKITFYLKNEDQREKIRLAGQQRTLNEHTYEHRFRNIFSALLKT